MRMEMEGWCSCGSGDEGKLQAGEDGQRGTSCRSCRTGWTRRRLTFVWLFRDSLLDRVRELVCIAAASAQWQRQRGGARQEDYQVVWLCMLMAVMMLTASFRRQAEAARRWKMFDWMDSRGKGCKVRLQQTGWLERASSVNGAGDASALETAACPARATTHSATTAAMSPCSIKRVLLLFLY